MLSEKTKELFAAFLESLKEDTGLEPENVTFWQYDHRGNTTEEHANSLVSRFNFEIRTSDSYNSAARYNVPITDNTNLDFYYFYTPEETEEDDTVTCKECEKEFEAVDMDPDNEEFCLKCSYELKKELEEEQKAQLRDWQQSR